LPHSTNLVKLLQRIRDENHRFAVSYHSTLKRNRQTISTLEEISGIGPATRKKLIKSFGSISALKEVSEPEVAEVIGSQKAALLKPYLAPAKN
ncbi:MAG: helix-hairpin-helix domain-containing protein, partial [Candidatus Saccharimonadales bacterium]